MWARLCRPGKSPGKTTPHGSSVGPTEERNLSDTNGTGVSVDGQLELLQFGDEQGTKRFRDAFSVVTYIIDSLTQGVADALAARDADRSQNGEDNHDSRTGVRRQDPLARECTYPDFMKCKPLYFKDSWSQTHDVAYAMTWTNLKKKTTDKYCPRGEIKKLEVEMWNPKVKGTDVCKESKPKRMEDAVEFATELIDKKIRTLLNVRLRVKGSKMITNSKKTRGRTLAGPMLLGLRRRIHMRDLSHCALYATITMMVLCSQIPQVQQSWPSSRDCRSPAATNNKKNLTCNECGNQGRYMNDCPELKNQNHENQARGTRACGKVHALGG
nr:hypothetical protein [Tanacetum cinerariifolium]